MGRLNVGAAQIGTDADINENLEKIMDMLDQAVKAECDVVLFHEGCLTGYPEADRAANLDFDLIAASEERVRQFAEENSIAVLLGSCSKLKGGVANDLLIINEEGIVQGRYAKTWRAGEPWYVAGSGPVIFTVCGVEATSIICHDLRYPELVRLGVAAGARLVFIANNEAGLDNERKQLGYRSMQVSRATENYVFAVMANPPEDPEQFGRKNSSHGNSKIVDPLGNVLDEAGHFEERLVSAEIDLAESDGNPVRRVLGEDEKTWGRYDTVPEHPAIAAWLKEGVKLVTRIEP